jgi:hypothetical protein
MEPPVGRMNRDSSDLATALFLVLALVVGGWFLMRADELIEPGRSVRTPAAASPSTSAGPASPGPGPSGPSSSTGPGGSPEPGQTGSPRPTQPTPSSTPGAVEVSVAASKGFASAVRTDWAEAAAIQSMQNILAGTNDEGRATQQTLRARAVALTPRGEPKVGGMGPSAWAAVLTELGYPYELRTAASRGAALKLAARAIQATGRPAGLVTSAGLDSWVMTGFRATDDPASGRAFEVTAARIQDPWYPATVAGQGKTYKPGTWHGGTSLRRSVVPYQVVGATYPKLEGKFLVVLPLAAEQS